MSDSLFSVEEQVVLVSGASRGIGRAIAQGFVQRKARVIVTGRERKTIHSTAEQLDPTGALAEGIVCDVSKPMEIARLVDNVMSNYGRIDTLVNVAGINRRKPAEQLTDDDYDAILDTNLKGAYLLSLEVGKHQIKEHTGNQINIVSLNNDRPLRGVMPYAMSKAALGQMTKALALEWGPFGIRVNAIAPGFIYTDLSKKLWNQPQMRMWGTTNAPLRRLGQPEDMVGTAIFLASDASAFITGQIIFVDGGFSAGYNWPIIFEEPNE